MITNDGVGIHCQPRPRVTLILKNSIAARRPHAASLLCESREPFYKCRAIMPYQCPADLLISSNVIYIPLVSYSPRASNHQGASSLSLLSLLCVLRSCPHRLHHPSYHVCWPKETPAGSWKEKGVKCISFCLPLFNSCFFSALMELPIVELLNWMQFLSASPLPPPQLHLPFSSRGSDAPHSC